MNEKEHISIADYSYSLPESRIAKHPLPARAHSKMLVYRQGSVLHRRFDEIAGFLPAHSRLVFNNTKVIQARLQFHKESGAKIEIFCLEPNDPAGYEQSFESMQGCTWKCLVGNAKKWKTGAVSLECMISGRALILRAWLVERLADSFLVRFFWDSSDYSFGEIIESAGSTPIPPYLNRDAEEDDKLRYQTVYGRRSGSVAAPTAGLHFTDEILDELKAGGHQLAELTLHVGAGTFVPVKHKNAREHSMHEELVLVKREFIQSWMAFGRKVIAVGTTSTRSLETIYWLGAKLLSGAGIDPVHTEFRQWDNEVLEGKFSLGESLAALDAFMEKHACVQLQFTTSLMIVPGYRFRAVSGLITNFHMPGSTLLLLIAALIGEDWRKVYREALDNQYRFLSYGDSSLLLPVD